MNSPAASSDVLTNPPSEAAIDRELIARFLTGDESAFNEIMKRHRVYIRSAARSVLRDSHDAEEIVQDTFLRAYRGLAKFRGDCTLSTWLYRIAINLGRNRYWYFFRRRRHLALSLEFTDDGSNVSINDVLPGSDADPSQESSRAEFTQLVSTCMERLDGQHREVLDLWNIKGLSYLEIATQLGIKTGTVKSRIARARASLRNFLNAQCPQLNDAEFANDYFLSGTRLHSSLTPA